MAQLICRNLSVGYTAKPVLRNLNFEVNRGDYLLVIGENGAGKSTLIKTILGLQTPIDGEISAGEGLLKSEIGYLPQQSEIQKDFPASVREIVLSGCLAGCGRRPFYSKKEKQTAQSAMNSVNIGSLAGRCYRELSGGQQQRVLLARALCAGRKMLILDEPVSGLDPEAAADMYRLIERLNKEHGITVIMITHNISSALKYASHILCLGSSTFFGKKEDYLKSAAGRCEKGGESQ